MAIKEISADAIYQNSMERTANRPTEATRFGRGGMNAAQVKANYDRLALQAVEKVNELIRAINADASEESIAALIRVPITDPDNDQVSLTLYDVMIHIISGELAEYLQLDGLLEGTLQAELERLEIWSGEKRQQAADDVYQMIKDDPHFDGKDAYEVAVADGFEGTRTEWLASLSFAPPVTEADEGKTLRVVDGKWQVAPLGGSELLWAEVQRAVRAGYAPGLYPVGTQFTVRHSRYGAMLFDVVAHNHYKSAEDAAAPTMTLVCRNVVCSLPYDSPKAFYYATKDLPAGTYNFYLNSAFQSWEAGYYNFTTTVSIPKGGQLRISGDGSAALTSRSIAIYESPKHTTAMAWCAIKKGRASGATVLCYEYASHFRRGVQGSNNYKESAIRQFLNTSGTLSEAWVPQTGYDRPPTWPSSQGLLDGFDEDFLSRVGTVVVPCVANDAYEYADSDVVTGEKYTVEDKFYLLSEREVFGTDSDGLRDGSALLPFYKDTSAVDRVKYKDGTASHWWTRTVRANYPGSLWMVGNNGDLASSTAINSRGCVFACNIV